MTTDFTCVEFHPFTSYTHSGINPMVKVWNYDKLDRAGNATCVRLFRALAGSEALNVTCISVHENLSQLAIGFENGTILLYKGSDGYCFVFLYF